MVRRGRSRLPRVALYTQYWCFGRSRRRGSVQISWWAQRPIAFYSRIMNSAQRNYWPTRRELLAVTAAVQHFRHYWRGTNSGPHTTYDDGLTYLNRGLQRYTRPTTMIRTTTTTPTTTTATIIVVSAQKTASELFTKSEHWWSIGNILISVKHRTHWLQEKHALGVSEWVSSV